MSLSASNVKVILDNDSTIICAMGKGDTLGWRGCKRSDCALEGQDQQRPYIILIRKNNIGINYRSRLKW